MEMVSVSHCDTVMQQIMEMVSVSYCDTVMQHGDGYRLLLCHNHAAWRWLVSLTVSQSCRMGMVSASYCVTNMQHGDG